MEFQLPVPGATHTCREADELKYSADTVAATLDNELVGELAMGRLLYFPSTPRQESQHMGRITTLMENGEFFRALNISTLDPETDRVMICGSMHFMKDIRAIIEPMFSAFAEAKAVLRNPDFIAGAERQRFRSINGKVFSFFKRQREFCPV